MVALDEEGTALAGQEVRYFVERFPSRDQRYTSADGLFVILNTPTDAAKVTAWVADGAGGHTWISQASVVVDAGGFSLVDLHTGVSGPRMPDECR